MRVPTPICSPSLRVLRKHNELASARIKAWKLDLHRSLKKHENDIPCLYRYNRQGWLVLRMLYD